jgi:hypothetical protein
MRYLALAMSLDGTLETAGRLDAALEQLRRSGRRAILVTARRLGELHLWHGDFSRWIRHVLRDDGLAREISTIERRYELPAAESRRQVLDVITHRYALPA